MKTKVDKVVEDDDSAEFKDENASDSFDDDFDEQEDEPHADDDKFDLEAYKKWKEQHPESEEDFDEEDFEDEEGFEDELEDDSDE